MKIIKLTLLMLLIVSCAYANPSIDSVEINGSVLSVNGELFGSKSTAAPIKFDDMETGEVGSELTISGWTSNASGGAIYNADQAYSGTLSAYNYAETDGGGSSIGRGAFDTSYLEFANTDTVYCSFYFRYSVADGDGYCIQKLCRIAGPSATSPHYDGPGTMKISDMNPSTGGSGTGKYTKCSYDPGDGDADFNDLSVIAVDTWYRFEYVHSLGDAGVANGITTCEALGVGKIGSSSFINRNGGETFTLNSLLLGLMPVNITNGDVDPNKVELWMDDVYVDNTTSRVVIGNNADFDSCTKRRDQPATAWSATSINCTLDTAGFESDETLYVFVVDSDNVVSNSIEYDKAPIEITGQMASNGGTIQFN